MKNATMNDSHLLDDVLAFDNMGRTVYGAEYLDRLASAFATLDIDATKWCTHYIMVHFIVVQIHKYKYSICDAKWCRANVAVLSNTKEIFYVEWKARHIVTLW